MSSNIIGFILVLIGGLTSAFFLNPILYAIIFVGVFLFASIYDYSLFADYVIVNSNELLVRKRYYVNFLPFTIVSSIITLGKCPLKIVYKEEYFKALSVPGGNIEYNKISRKEYVALRNEQRIIYSTQKLSREFMKKSYTLDDIAYKRKKTRLITAIVFAVISLMMLVEPDGIYLFLIYEPIFLPMAILWFCDYKDAKILQQAYDRAVNEEPVRP